MFTLTPETDGTNIFSGAPVREIDPTQFVGATTQVATFVPGATGTCGAGVTAVHVILVDVPTPVLRLRASVVLAALASPTAKSDRHRTGIILIPVIMIFPFPLIYVDDIGTCRACQADRRLGAFLGANLSSSSSSASFSSLAFLPFGTFIRFSASTSVLRADDAFFSMIKRFGIEST